MMLASYADDYSHSSSVDSVAEEDSWAIYTLCHP